MAGAVGGRLGVQGNEFLRLPCSRLADSWRLAERGLRLPASLRLGGGLAFGPGSVPRVPQRGWYEGCSSFGPRSCSRCRGYGSPDPLLLRRGCIDVEVLQSDIIRIIIGAWHLKCHGVVRFVHRLDALEVLLLSQTTAWSDFMLVHRCKRRSHGHSSDRACSVHKAKALGAEAGSWSKQGMCGACRHCGMLRDASPHEESSVCCTAAVPSHTAARCPP